MLLLKKTKIKKKIFFNFYFIRLNTLLKNKKIKILKINYIISIKI